MSIIRHTEVTLNTLIAESNLIVEVSYVEPFEEYGRFCYWSYYSCAPCKLETLIQSTQRNTCEWTEQIVQSKKV